MECYIDDQFYAYEVKKSQLLQALKASPGKVTLKKKTASNLFRYLPHSNHATQSSVVVSDFDNIISIDTEKGILEVEGLCSYEKIVQFTLKHGFLPTVTPELKHITIGGATVGIGIESSGHKYGFVHDGLLEADVLLPEGKIILARPDNEYADLFFGLPNSYGTLGYILRAKIKLYPAKPYVHMAMKRYATEDEFLQAMREGSDDPETDFLEGLVFSKNELYLLKSKLVAKVNFTDDIYRKNIFYQLIRDKTDIFLTTEDYIFRYDPDWFWNIPEGFLYTLFRRWAPKRWRNSGFYKKYIDGKKKWLDKLGIRSPLNKKEEPLIQDWEVPWDRSQELLRFALEHIDLNGKPWAIIPIQSFQPATLYPLQPNTLYFNLGCYCYSKSRDDNLDPYFNTKLMDDYCFALNGLKMLYSSTFLSKEQFSALYNGEAYRLLREKYDPADILKSLNEKVTCRSL